MKKGFTLIELVIVIGILAILAAAVILVLNPAELLAQARDSQRLSDLGSVKSAIALYLATSLNPNINASTTCTANSLSCSTILGPFNTGTYIYTSSTAVTGGWVAVDLTGTTGGAPLSAVPIDPSNPPSGTAGNYFYAFKGDSPNKTFVIAGRLESAKYRVLMTSDGGPKSTCSSWTGTDCYYEIGTAPGLTIP